jgi:hypothetical protein
MSEIIYVGKGKTSKFGIKVNLCINDIAEYAKANIQPAKDGKKYIRLDVNTMKAEDQYGNTHTVKVDTWKPEPKTEAAKDEEPQQVKCNPYYDNLKNGIDEDVPF